MALLGLDSKVTYNGQVWTIRKLAERGEVRLVAFHNCGNQSPYHSEYWAKTDADSGWRIGKMAYNAAIKQFPALVGDYAEPVTQTGPYTFAEYTEALRQRFTDSKLAWLPDAVGNGCDWRKAYRHILTAPLDELAALAERIETQGNNWDETQESYA
jgi:hypothetical protein